MCFAWITFFAAAAAVAVFFLCRWFQWFNAIWRNEQRYEIWLIHSDKFSDSNVLGCELGCFVGLVRLLNVINCKFKMIRKILKVIQLILLHMCYRIAQVIRSHLTFIGEKLSSHSRSEDPANQSKHNLVHGYNKLFFLVNEKPFKLWWN